VDLPVKSRTLLANLSIGTVVSSMALSLQLRTACHDALHTTPYSFL
jgi:hypothetical protein